MQGPRAAPGGVNVLGLHVSGDGEKLLWRWGSDVPEVQPIITCWSTFFMCRKLIGHFSICSWLIVVAAAIKHRMTSVMSGWDEVHNVTLRCMITETMERVMQDNPMQGDWCINRNKLTIWVDASSQTMGVTLEDKGSIIEDACWLRPENDMLHINLVELDATLKGINLVLQWQAIVPHIIMDSACTQCWISDALTRRARLTTKALSKMLIRRQLTMLTETIKEYNLSVDVVLVKSTVNRADALTRILQCWLTAAQKESKPLQLLCTASTQCRPRTDYEHTWTVWASQD